MKRAKVSALRERGLRADVCRRAEPQCLVTNANKERKADTMKTYILRPVKAVHSENHLPQPAGRTAGSPPALFIGLDVHNDSIAVSLAPSDSTEVRRYGIIGGGTRRRAQARQKTPSRPSRSEFAVLLRSRAARVCPVPVPAGARLGLYFGLPL